MKDRQKPVPDGYQIVPDEELIQKLLKMMSNKARRVVFKVSDLPGHEDELLVVDMKWERDELPIDHQAPISHILN